jgi:hypothetical protein
VQKGGSPPWPEGQGQPAICGQGPGAEIQYAFAQNACDAIARA